MFKNKIILATYTITSWGRHFIMFQLSKQSYNDSKFKMESEGGSNSDFDDNDYSLEMNYDFLDLGIKEESLDVKKDKLDPDYEETVVS